MENVCCDCMYNSFVEHTQEICVGKNILKWQLCRFVMLLVVDILSTGCLRNRMCVHLGLKLVHCVYNTLQNRVAETLQFSLIIEVFTDSALNQLYSVFLFWDFPD